MIAMTSAIVWTALQVVVLFSLIGGAAFALLKSRRPIAALVCVALVFGLVVSIALTKHQIESIESAEREAEREAGRRGQSLNNLKQLGLALFNYEEVHKHFPTSAVSGIGNAQSKGTANSPKCSWRVAILPFIEEVGLYQEYHFDEPWDSEHNKALIAKMPAVFRDPHDDASSTNASYFMPTGEGMFGGMHKGISPFDIGDGESRTIMLVETKRDIPWTKPEDIEIDADASKPLPELGGHLASDQFAVAMADGSVRTLPKSMDPKLLHAMFTIDGGEIISDEDLENPPKKNEWQESSKPKTAPNNASPIQHSGAS